MQKANRIAFNTGITYARLAVTIVISLYSTRLVLSSLGASDFGLFNVVGGIVAMLTFLNIAMTTTTQRYLSFSLGKGDIGKVRRIFANSLLLHYAIALFLVIVIELIGLYFINYKLEIDPARINAANWLLHFVVISTFITIISSPYDALINAHENMVFLAVVNLIEAFLKLGIAASLLIYHNDRLILYGMLTMMSTILVRIIKGVYSTRKYAETKVRLRGSYDKKEVKELTGFASWNLLGVICYIGRNQGIAVVLNLFFSTVLNAAYGIANQVNGQLSFFSSTLIQAIQPQIVKSEGGGDRQRLIMLSVLTSKLSVFLFSLVALPIYVELPFILEIWLKTVPPETVIFCKLIIILTLILQFKAGITVAAYAIGNIREYQLINSPIQLLSIPIGYILFLNNFEPYWILIVTIIIEAIVLLVSIHYFKRLTGYAATLFYKNVVLPCLLVLVLSYTVVMLFSKIGDGFFFHAMVIIFSFLLFLAAVFFLGLNKNERLRVHGLVDSVKRKILK